MVFFKADSTVFLTILLTGSQFYFFACLTHCDRDKMATIFPDEILKCILMNENVWISIEISKPMMVSLLTHIWVTRSQWVNSMKSSDNTQLPQTLLISMYLCIPFHKIYRIHAHGTHQGGSFFLVFLNHWGRVMHICVSKIIIIGSDNGLSPSWRQAIIWTNVGILLIGSLWTNFSGTSVEIHIFSSEKMHLKMSSAKWRLFRLGLSELIQLDETLPRDINGTNYGTLI